VLILVHPEHMGTDVERNVIVTMGLHVTMLREDVNVCPATPDLCARKSVPMDFLEKTASKSAGVKMKASATLWMEAANVVLDGKVPRVQSGCVKEKNYMVQSAP